MVICYAVIEKLYIMYGVCGVHTFFLSPALLIMYFALISLSVLGIFFLIFSQEPAVRKWFTKNYMLIF